MFSLRESSGDSDQPLHLPFHLTTRTFNPSSVLLIMSINVAPLAALEVQNSLPFQVIGSGQPKFISFRSTRVPPQGPRHPSDTKLVQIYTAVTCAPQTHQPGAPVSASSNWASPLPYNTLPEAFANPPRPCDKARRPCPGSVNGRRALEESF